MKDFKFQDYGVVNKKAPNYQVGAEVLESKKRDLLVGMNIYSISSTPEVTNIVELLEGIRSERGYFIFDFLNGKNGVKKTDEISFNRVYLENVHRTLDAYVPEGGTSAIINFAINAALYTTRHDGQHANANRRLVQEGKNNTVSGRAIVSNGGLWSRVVNNTFWEMGGGTNFDQEDFNFLQEQLVANPSSEDILSGLHYFDKIKKFCTVPNAPSLGFDVDTLQAYSFALSQRMDAIQAQNPEMLDEMKQLYVSPLFEELDKRVSTDEPERMIDSAKATLIGMPLKEYQEASFPLV